MSPITSPLLDPRLHRLLAEQPHPLLFATLSGAHLYGFPSPDSDVDLRGAHVVPLRDMVGLEPRDETLEDTRVIDGLEIDIVTQDLRKFMGLLLKRNGYALEQLLSPLVVRTSPAHEELKALAPGCLTRHHAHHYLGFARNQWRLFLKESPRRVKPLLYVYRVLLTGIHLVRTGELEANLNHLNDIFRLPFIQGLVARKVGGREQEVLDGADAALHEASFNRLLRDLEAARDASPLPGEASESARAGLNDLLVRVRLAAT